MGFEIFRRKKLNSKETAPSVDLYVMYLCKIGSVERTAAQKWSFAQHEQGALLN